MAYIGNIPAPQNINSSEITDGSIVNVDIASDAAIAATKIAGLSTVATTGAYGDLSGTPSLVTSLADLGVTASAADLNTTDVTTLGTVEASKVVTADANGDVKFPDNEKAVFGTGNDLLIYHDGGNSHIKEEGSGILFISGSSEIQLRAATDEVYIQCIENSGVNLRHDNSQKLSTTSTGIDVTGNATFGDNGKSIFGAGSDLQIYHDGTNSYIDDSGTGSLLLRSDRLRIGKYTGENMIEAYADGQVELYYDSTKRIETTSVGADVTGELIADSYNETYSAVTSSSNATTVDCHAGNSFSHTLTENTTFTFSNPPASGTAYSFSIEIIQDASASGFTVGWPSGVISWPAATAPTLTATASAKDIFVFTTRDGGTNWYGFTAGQALG
jgi:hypothetical protein